MARFERTGLFGEPEFVAEPDQNADQRFPAHLESVVELLERRRVIEHRKLRADRVRIDHQRGNGHSERLPVAFEFDCGGLSLPGGEGRKEGVVIRHRSSVELPDPVSGQDSGFFGRIARLGSDDDESVFRRGGIEADADAVDAVLFGQVP